MMENQLLKADGNGQIDVKGQLSPVAYNLVAHEDDESYAIDVSLMAPRDWLLQRGFEDSAVLVSENGTRIPVHFEKKLKVEDDISVELKGSDHCESRDEIGKKYPEIKLS